MRKSSGYGTGRVYRPTYRDTAGKLKQQKKYWLAYPKDGEQVREPANTTVFSEAVTLLKSRLSGTEAPAKAAAGTPFTITSLIELIENDYAQEGRKSIMTLRRSRFPHLKAYFSDIDLRPLDLPAVKLYRDTRKTEKASNGSINREVAVLVRGFRLAYERNIVDKTIHVKKLKESPARSGFFEWDSFQQVLGAVDAWWHELYTVAYITGWRMDTELVTMQWSQVDFLHKTLRLDPGTTKTDDGRNFPFTPMLETALKAQQARVKALAKAKGRIITWVFPRKHTAAPLTSGYKPLKYAAVETGFAKAMPHDFRRTAVRNLEQAGVPRPTAKRMVGHKTDSMYERYNIVDKRSMDVGRTLLSAYEATVLAFSEASKKAAAQ